MYYRKQYSARKLAEQLGVSVDSVYYFMRRHDLKRRSFSEENKRRFESKKPSFCVKKKLTNKDELLKLSGVMLYWGEGSKVSSDNRVDFTNSDPAMIVLFVNFLKKVCRVDHYRLRCYLYCFSNQDVKSLIGFWSEITGIQKGQFSKPYIKNVSDDTKKNKMPYGLIHIRYSDKKLLQLLLEWIEEYKGRLSVGGRAVNYTSL